MKTLDYPHAPSSLMKSEVIGTIPAFLSGRENIFSSPKPFLPKEIVNGEFGKSPKGNYVQDSLYYDDNRFAYRAIFHACFR